MMNNTNTQDAFAVIREMGALAATQGISEENVLKANEIIKNLITKVVEPAVQKLTATNAGLRV